jgi:hypothetical protein
MKRAYYASNIQEFCKQDPSQILGAMTREHGFDLTPYQRDAWLEQTSILKDVLYKYTGRIYFEFSIPRMGRRIDAVVIIQSVIFVIEFKVGAEDYELASLDQVMDYALDLHYFHEGSHQAILAPILVATKAPARDIQIEVERQDSILSPLCCNRENVGKAIADVLSVNAGNPVNYAEWEQSLTAPHKI